MALSLDRLKSFPGVAGPVVVVVMDGVGIGAENEGNAVWLARKPILDGLAKTSLTTQLRAHGTAVGMPSDDDMGNSEVGHNALGAGRIFDQGAKLVRAAIESGSIWAGEAWAQAVRTAKASGEPLHFIGLLSDGNVHSHIEHLIAMLRRADEEGVAKVRVHALLDGRDVPETSALQYVDQIEAVLAEISKKPGRDYRVASGGGRMTTTMDRYEADWSMVERGWKVHIQGEGRQFPSLRAAVEALRAEKPGVIDQNLPSFVIGDGGTPVGPIRDGAAVIFFNFRGDRAIEITRAFEQEHFGAFDRGHRPKVFFAGMMQYDGDLRLPLHFLVPPPAIDRTIGEYFASMGIPQLAISETQKFGHVTYFWNGNRTEPFDPKTETYLEVPSDTLPFEERPWMKAAEITDRLIAELQTGKHRFARVNYANGDMVGHTGSFQATVIAMQVIDLQLARLRAALDALDGVLVVTADHGNADEMYQHSKDGRVVRDSISGVPVVKTSHTLNPVPFMIHDRNRQNRYVVAADAPVTDRTVGIANVTATCLELLGFVPPEGLEPSLLRFEP